MVALLLQSTGFAAPKKAGQAIAQLQTQADALAQLAQHLAPVEGVDTAMCKRPCKHWPLPITVEVRPISLSKT